MTYKILKNETALIDAAVNNLLKETQKEYIEIFVEPEDEELDIFKSKVGGVPYIPKEVEVPCSKNNTQLAFLAQINCTELPENDFYPKKGLLQFWIARDNLFGINDKKGHKVLYFEKIDTNITKEDVLKKYKLLDKNDHSPIRLKNANFSLSFKMKTDSMNQTVFNFEETLINKINKVAPEKNITDLWEDIEKEAYEHALDYFTTSGSQIGGYPSFCQYDPRGELPKNYDVVLFQLDSLYNFAEPIEIVWGDDGIGNFLISKKDLENLNFEDVLYTWDCY